MARTRLICLALAAAVTVAAARTGGTEAATAACEDQRLVQPFAPWLDYGNYVLLRNGALESTYGWQLAGGAQLIWGNEPWKVNARSDARSLSLRPGSSATSPALCVTLFHPTLRFFARNGGAATSALKVEAITQTAGVSTTLTVGLLTASGWQPTVPLAFLENLASPLSGTVRFRFTPLGWGGAWQIDDVYVDPFKGR